MVGGLPNYHHYVPFPNKATEVKLGLESLFLNVPGSRRMVGSSSLESGREAKLNTNLLDEIEFGAHESQLHHVKMKAGEKGSYFRFSKNNIFYALDLLKGPTYIGANLMDQFPTIWMQMTFFLRTNILGI